MFFVIIVFILFFVVADRYIFKSSFFSQIKAKITAHLNDKKFEKAVRENIESRNDNSDVISRKLDLKLVHIGSGWSLIGNDDYRITMDKGKLAITRKQDSTGVDFKVDVIGVDTYFPIKNTV
ncbi:MAG: hypothetical protein Q8M92_07895, partial [Candidatus Subteraquimicrobiales bacterium]|nr:hypothetical protein [Candidatus Subteraquimicrobiales bacterium]